MTRVISGGLVAGAVAAAALLASAGTGGAQSRPVPPTPMPVAADASDGPTIVISMQGVASRPPDVASLNVSIVTNDDASAVATSKNNAIYDALRAKLSELGIAEAAIKTSYFNVSFTPRPGTVYASPAPTMRPLPPATAAPMTPSPLSYPNPTYVPRYGYVATRQLAVTVAAVANAGAVVDAALAAGVTTVSNVQFQLVDKRAAYDEALARALKDAGGQAQAVATAGGMHLGPVKNVRVSPALLNQQLVGTQSTAPRGAAVSAPRNAGTDLRPAPVEVRADVTVTYSLLP